MFNYFLHTAFLATASFEGLQQCLVELNEVQTENSDAFDHFYKEESLNRTNHVSGESVLKTLFTRLQSKQLMHQVLPMILARMEQVPDQDDDIKIVNVAFPEKKNAYWGVVFPSKQIYYLSTVESYLAFRQHAVGNVSISDFWSMRKFLFPHIEFCQQTKRQLQKITEVKNFSDILTCLGKLNEYARTWKQGDFDMSELEKMTNASYESKPTMDQFGKERTFKITDTIGKKACSAHLKADHIRAHFYPDNMNHKVYVAYIGPHLKTHRYR